MEDIKRIRKIAPLDDGVPEDILDSFCPCVGNFYRILATAFPEFENSVQEQEMICTKHDNEYCINKIDWAYINSTKNGGNELGSKKYLSNVCTPCFFLSQQNIMHPETIQVYTQYCRINANNGKTCFETSFETYKLHEIASLYSDDSTSDEKCYFHQTMSDKIGCCYTPLCEYDDECRNCSIRMPKCEWSQTSLEAYLNLPNFNHTVAVVETEWIKSLIAKNLRVQESDVEIVKYNELEGGGTKIELKIQTLVLHMIVKNSVEKLKRLKELLPSDFIGKYINAIKRATINYEIPLLKVEIQVTKFEEIEGQKMYMFEGQANRVLASVLSLVLGMVATFWSIV